MRQLCLQCGTYPRAINYHKHGKIYYRKLCDRCNRNNAKKKSASKERWQLAGYKKKNTCEKCGFKPVMLEQLRVFNTSRNQQQIAVQNLKTVCLNCNFELSKTGWTQGDLLEDR